MLDEKWIDATKPQRNFTFGELLKRKPFCFRDTQQLSFQVCFNKNSRETPKSHLGYSTGKIISKRRSTKNHPQPKKQNQREIRSLNSWAKATHIAEKGLLKVGSGGFAYFDKH
ncbi:hypothetical protein [Rufibacter latericius]|uniref:Uncharacterized protein n=1 Tax=Rufibacter latericius TaxID=2487040 RepID=A0A3M9M9X6_9BACT|nr:hypothetical protein [Rufibacter latericius]RNI22371.1 hypothetical protein EFB08_19860 [Rufibacter latericius]